jgi:hypothetical protein
MLLLFPESLVRNNTGKAGTNTWRKRSSYPAEDAPNLVKDLYADTIEELLEVEMNYNPRL